MKKTTPAVLMALVIASLAAIGMGCSQDSAPAKSSFAAEHGQWNWVESEGGLNNELVQVDSVDFNRVLAFETPAWASLAEFDKDNHLEFLYFEGPYSVVWETHDSVRVRVVHYSDRAYASQLMNFLGNDTLVLTDLAIDGYTHTYLRSF